MKKVLMAAIAVVAFGMWGCSKSEPDRNGSTPTTPARKTYTCSMKCTTSEAPGKCPKCGMEMTEQK